MTTASERFDVIVVGARCAGSPLAAMLAREGVKVALLERASFPRDTLSGHVFEADALAFLDRLGVTDELRATGAPFIRRFEIRFEDFRCSMDLPQRPEDIGGFASVRRFVLDPILAAAAAEAGADLRTGTKVTGLIEDGGRVVGVRASSNGKEAELRARLVVGADGRNSTVAGLCGARKYNLTPNERINYWAYFEGADLGPEPTFIAHRWDDRLVLATPMDGGLYQVSMFPALAERDRFRSDLEGSFMEHVRSCEPIGEAIAGARRASKFIGSVRWVGFFREASGPGWVLVGDAGHFKDPTVGRGIGDAFLQVDALAPAIVGGFDGSGDGLDAAMTRWGRWRDREFAEHYWSAADFGKAGRMPLVQPEMLRSLHRKEKVERFYDLFAHRAKPSEVFTPPGLLGATARLVLARGGDRRAVLKEVGALLADDVQRRRLNRRPAYAPAGRAADDAGATEIEDSAGV